MASAAQAADTKSTRPVVLFDGGCPLCRREVAHYRRLEASAALDWVDISASEEQIQAFGVSIEQAMARFHVRDAQGRWQTGAWGFMELWSHLPGYRFAARLLRTLRLVPLVDRAYSPFARWRLRRRCDAGTCSTAPADHKHD